MITYHISNARDCFDEIRRLFQEHYEEVSLLGKYQLMPDYEIYFAADKKEKVKVVLAKHNGGIVGYIVFFINHHLHYMDCLLASEDIYFLKKEYRKGSTGIRMFKFAEDYLRSIGVDMIKYSTKTHLDNSRIFEYLGYKNTEKVYTKMLKD